MMGFTSLFTDMSSEMIQVVLPTFVKTVLGGGYVTLGFVLGFSEAISNIIKGISGWLSERLRKRKGLVIAGYSLSNLVAKPLMGFQKLALPVVLLKVVERLGKGIRTAPRDALIAYHSGKKSGKSFGAHRAMDTLGAVFGPLLAALLLLLMFNEAQVIILSIIPGLIAVVFLFFVKDIKQEGRPKVDKKKESGEKETISKKFIRVVAVLAVVEFASLNTGFLIARGNEFYSEHSELFVPLFYALFNVIYAVVALKAGAFSDKIGRKKIILLGLSFLLGSTILLAMPWQTGSVVALILTPVIFVIFGLYIGMVDPLSRAMVSDLSEKKKGKAYGLYYFLVGIVSIPESILFGYLWDSFSPTVAFLFSASILAVCMLVFFIAVPESVKKLIKSSET